MFSHYFKEIKFLRHKQDSLVENCVSKFFNTVSDEFAEVCFTDAAYRVDVGAGAVIFGHVATQTERILSHKMCIHYTALAVKL